MIASTEANVAQLVVRLICNQTVGGSSPSVGSTATIGKTAFQILIVCFHIMVECNIDAKGKAARFVGGLASIAGAFVLAALLLTETLTLDFGWYAVAAAVFGGAFAIFEARAGWCIVRALGFKTPL